MADVVLMSKIYMESLLATKISLEGMKEISVSP
jgi:hypothetical protein